MWEPGRIGKFLTKERLLQSREREREKLILKSSGRKAKPLLFVLHVPPNDQVIYMYRERKRKEGYISSVFNYSTVHILYAGRRE